MPLRDAYARLLSRARRGDAAAAPLIGLIVAAVIYLLLFTILLAVTGEQDDTTGLDFRVLSDRAESSLALLLGGTGEATNVTANPSLLMSGSTVLQWTLDNGASALRETKSGLGATKFTRSSTGLAANTTRVPVSPGASYRAEATVWGASTVDVVWYKDEDTSDVHARDEGALSFSASSWASAISTTLTPPEGAYWVTLELRGQQFWANRTLLTIVDAAAWENAPDGLGRFSLLEENLIPYGFNTKRATNVIDYAKLATLKRGEMISKPNGGADYPDVKTALGIGPTFDFHIRTFPVFPELDGDFVKDAALEVAYIGDYATQGGGQVEPGEGHLDFGAITEGPGSPPTYIQVAIQVTNDGDAPAAFRVVTTLTADSGGGNSNVVDNTDTPYLAPTASATVFVKFYGVGNQADWKLGNTLQAKLLDVQSNQLDLETSSVFTKPADTGNKFNVKVEPASAVFYTSDSTVEVFFDHYDARGNRLNSAQTADYEIRTIGGSLVASGTLSLPKNKATSITCSACLAAETYTVTATAGARTWTEGFQTIAPSPPTSADESPSSKVESGILSELVDRFTNSTARSPAQADLDVRCASTLISGDKYVDTKEGTEDLANRLFKSQSKLCYQLLVVGSNVAHNAMTSAGVKYKIADWVAAGGTLVVLGSSGGNVEWLQPVGGQGLRSASGGIGAPDPTHPILTSPDRLAYKSYKDPGQAWELKEKNADDYTHVLVRDQTQQGSNDMLAVSEAGVFGKGTVILSAYMPFDLMDGNSPGEREEGKRLLHNLVSQAYSQLYVDFGPAIPPGAQVASTSRLALVPHPLVPGALTQIEILMYVFQ